MANIPSAVPEWTSSTQIVYGFIEWKFDLTEVRNFVDALVDSEFVAPNAAAFFRHFNDDLTVLTGDLTFYGGNLPPCILEFTCEFSNAKLFGELAYRRIKQVWNDTLCSIQTTPARSSVPTWTWHRVSNSCWPITSFVISSLIRCGLTKLLRAHAKQRNHSGRQVLYF